MAARIECPRDPSSGRTSGCSSWRLWLRPGRASRDAVPEPIARGPGAAVPEPTGSFWNQAPGPGTKSLVLEPTVWFRNQAIGSGTPVRELETIGPLRPSDLQ